MNAGFAPRMTSIKELVDLEFLQNVLILIFIKPRVGAFVIVIEYV